MACALSFRQLLNNRHRSPRARGASPSGMRCAETNGGDTNVPKQIWWEMLIAPMASMALARCCRFNSPAKAQPALACSLQPHILHRGGSCSL